MGWKSSSDCFSERNVVDIRYSSLVRKTVLHGYTIWLVSQMNFLISALIISITCLLLFLALENQTSRYRDDVFATYFGFIGPQGDVITRSSDFLPLISILLRRKNYSFDKLWC